MPDPVTNQVQVSHLPHAFEHQEEHFAEAFALLGEARDARVTPGASLAVTYRGKLIASRAFGRFTYEANSPEVLPDTIFDLASVTKAVGTTTMAMLLFERGALNLDQKISTFFREFQDGGKQEVTITMLLSHSSGLPAYEKLYQRCRTREELIGAAAAAPLSISPGTNSVYSDLGFILLGEVLAKIASEPLDIFLKREVFDPLKLTSMHYRPARRDIPPTQNDLEFRHRIIQGEVDDENASVIGGVAGHAGLFGNARDLSLFAECLLKDGQPLLSSETVHRFTTRRNVPAGTSFALGWDTPSPPSQSGTLLSAAAYGHLGFTGTSLWIDPERKLSITLLTNRTWPDRQAQGIKQLRPAVHDAIVRAVDRLA